VTQLMVLMPALPGRDATTGVEAGKTEVASYVGKPRSKEWLRFLAQLTTQTWRVTKESGKRLSEFLR
jgi:hypothetical protein